MLNFLRLIPYLSLSLTVLVFCYLLCLWLCRPWSHYQHHRTILGDAKTVVTNRALSPNAIDPRQPNIFQVKSQIYPEKNPSYIFLDFNAGTPEGRLKNCILRRENEIHDIVTSRKVVLEGQKGSGRTCIMRALPTCQDIQRKFVGPGKGGIYSISVGQNTDSNDVKKQMSEIVNMSGGSHLRERILHVNLSTAVFIMAEWFKYTDTLFLVDEIDSSPFARATEDQLGRLSKITTSSVVVFSRRIASRRVDGEHNDDVVHVPSGTDFGAEEWLLRCLEIDPRRQMEENSKAAFHQIIAFCNREKRLLGQASVCYKLVSRNRKNNESKWESLARLLSVVMRHKLDKEVTLTAVYLDLMKPEISSAFPGSRSIEKLYHAFHIVQVMGWIPLHELRLKWKFGPEEEEEFRTVRNILVKGRLCQITKRRVGDLMVEGMQADGSRSDSMRAACLFEVVVTVA